MLLSLSMLYEFNFYDFGIMFDVDFLLDCQTIVDYLHAQQKNI